MKLVRFFCGICGLAQPNSTRLNFEHAPDALIGVRDLERESRTLHLLEFDLESFENDDYGQFCCCEDLLPECSSHLKLETKLKLPLPCTKLVFDKRDKTKNWDRQRHYIPSKPGDAKLSVVNSCNGLLCLSDVDGNSFVVCNPVTGEFIRLPVPEAATVDISKTVIGRHREVYCGFGFQPKTNEYKVVRILKRYCATLREFKEFMAVEMHTLGTSTWKNVVVDPSDFKWLEFPTLFRGLGFPTCVSGALHWIGLYYRAILCFDFESERFQPFPSPPHLFENKKDTRNITMGELRGSLYICDSSSVDAPVKMWIMKKYGFGESWTMVFSIDIDTYRWPYGGLYWPVKQFKNGAAILMYHSSNWFIYYEPGKYRLNFFKVHGTQSTFEVIPHTPNFISLKDAVKGDNIEVLNVHSRNAEFKSHEESLVLSLAKVYIEVPDSDSTTYDEDEEVEEDEEEQGEEHTS